MVVSRGPGFRVCRSVDRSVDHGSEATPNMVSNRMGVPIDIFLTSIRFDFILSSLLNYFVSLYFILFYFILLPFICFATKKESWIIQYVYVSPERIRAIGILTK